MMSVIGLRQRLIDHLCRLLDISPGERLISRRSVAAGVLIFAAFVGIAIWRVNADTRLRHAYDVANFIWSPDGELIATSSKSDKLITVWSRDGTRLKEVERRGPITYSPTPGPLAFFPGNNDLIITAAERFPKPDNTAVSILDWKKGAWVRHLEAPPLPDDINIPHWLAATDFKVSPDGTKLLYVSGGMEYLTILSLPSGEPLGPSHETGRRPYHTQFVKDFQWHPNSREFAVLAGRITAIFEASDFKEIFSDMILYDGMTIAYSSNGRLLALSKMKSLPPVVNISFGSGGLTITTPPHLPIPATARKENIVVADRDTMRPIGWRQLTSETVRPIGFRDDDTLAFITSKALFSSNILYLLDIARIDQAEPQPVFRCESYCTQFHMSPGGKAIGVVDGKDVVIRRLQQRPNT